MKDREQHSFLVSLMSGRGFDGGVEESTIMSLWIIPFAYFGNASSTASRYSWTHTRMWCVFSILSFFPVCLFLGLGGVLLLSLSLSLSCTLRCVTLRVPRVDS